jgi:hypothetical protein
MSNVLTEGRLYSLDTRAVLSTKGIWVTKIVLVPNAAGDTATLSSWGNTVHATIGQVTGTISSSSVFGSTGNFTATNVTALDVITVVPVTGAAANAGTHLVLTRDNDNQITTVGVTLTDESSKVYYLTTTTPRDEVVLKCPATTGALVPHEMNFFENGGKRWFRNLALTALSTSAKVYIYLS